MTGNRIVGWFRELDRILRGQATGPQLLQAGDITLRTGGLTVVLVVLAMIYGACMGCYAVFGRAEPMYIQMLASALKVPLLFALTLLVTFPSLYVFNALVGSRLRLAAVLRLLMASLAVTVALLASLGPIVVFFSVCTTNYPFMILLNVAIYTIAGILGLKFLLQTLQRLSDDDLVETPAPQPESPGSDLASAQKLATALSEANTPPPPPLPGALDRLCDRPPSMNVRRVFRIWVVIFALVGAQMGWVLRPFVGGPTTPFEWFRARESNFFMAVLETIRALLGIGG